MKIEINTNFNIQNIKLEIYNKDLFRLANIGRATEIWKYLNKIEIKNIRGTRETQINSYYFFNPKNDLYLTIITNGQGIDDIHLCSLTKEINIRMNRNIETNAFYDLLDLFLRSDDKIDIGTLNEKKEAN